MYVNTFIIYSSFTFYLNSQHFTLIFHKKTDMLCLTVIIKLFCEYNSCENIIQDRVLFIWNKKKRIFTPIKLKK